MAVSKQPSITPETSSAEGLDDETSSRGEAKWKRFHPFRVVRKIFRRRIKREGTSVSDASKKSWSTSELQSVQDDGAGKREVTSPLKIGLSVSHDSIFSPETNTNVVSSETLNTSHGSSLSVHHTTIKNMFKDELFTRVRARRDSDDDDAGLPHSPCTSPTTVDVLTQGLKEKSSKSQTTCSAGSLISMGSSENDEDSAGQSSGHSSRMSLIDRRSLDSDGDTDSSQPVPLNHNAAHHRIAVKPKRTYGLPRRRMNQIAAAKVSTLPSTPEVTEDPGKSFQKLDTMEVVKTFTEFATASVNEFSSSRQSSEWQVSHMTSSFSYNEVSDLTREMISHKEKSTSESCSQIYKETKEDSCKLSSEETDKTSSDVDNIASEMQGTASHHLDFKESDTEFSSKDESKNFLGLKHDSSDKPRVDTATEISKSLKNENKEITKHALAEAKEFFQKESETSLKVSSLVKNLEKSESFKCSEKVLKGKEEIKATFGRNISHEQTSHTFKTNANTSLVENSETSSTSVIKEDLFPITFVEKTNESLTPEVRSDGKMQPSQDFIKEVKISNVPTKLDIDSEFVLKTIKKDNSSDKKLELSSKEKSGDKENSLISSLYFEEESIMSSKSLSMGVEESGIFVSHHVSYKDDLKDMIVTEAHNFAAVDENVEVFIQASGDIVKDKKKESIDPWISSVDIPSSITLDNDVTVNALTSTFCNSKMTDETITISVNSISETVTSVVSSHQQDDIKQNIPDSQNTTLMSKRDASQRPALKEKEATKSTPKSQLHEANSSITSVKNLNAQKRVSVEIVPFSQRMKERKYQPISFASKDPPSEQNKKNSGAAVERKLSDRKVTAKNKESEKAGSRHSFSGASISDSKKGEPVTEKKSVKPEKVQYPVQIRIHKSVPKPEIKDKVNTAASNKGLKNSSNKGNSNEVKFQMQAAKINQNDIKLLKEDKSPQDNPAKWEVKIQPSVSHNNNTQNIIDSDDNCSSLASETNIPTRNESRKSPIVANENKDFQTSQALESPPVKNPEINWKPSKEVPLTLSDDPEPELLRVFARRSIKQKHCDKSKGEEPQENPSSDASLDDSSQIDKSEENNEISISDNSTVIKILEISKPHIKTHDLKKKSKSFSEKEKVAPRSVSPLKEMNLIHRESLVKLTSDSLLSSETIHPRQRLASVPDIPLSLPPDTGKNSQKESSADSSPAPSIKEENLQRPSSTSVPVTTGSMNGSVTSIGMVKESQEMLNDKEPHAPSWLQLAQQRRELREQRERLLLGGSPNSFMDASNKPSRSSKVWDMVNNFQKLQMT